MKHILQSINAEALKKKEEWIYHKVDYLPTECEYKKLQKMLLLS